jgi:hypothetical protein
MPRRKRGQRNPLHNKTEAAKICLEGDKILNQIYEAVTSILRGNRLEICPGIQGSRDPGIQGSRNLGIHGSRDPEIQGSRDPGIQGSRDLGSQGSRDLGI